MIIRRSGIVSSLELHSSNHSLDQRGRLASNCFIVYYSVLWYYHFLEYLHSIFSVVGSTIWLIEQSYVYIYILVIQSWNFGVLDMLSPCSWMEKGYIYFQSRYYGFACVLYYCRKLYHIFFGMIFLHWRGWGVMKSCIMCFCSMISLHWYGRVAMESCTFSFSV